MHFERNVVEHLEFVILSGWIPRECIFQTCTALKIRKSAHSHLDTQIGSEIAFKSM